NHLSLLTKLLIPRSTSKTMSASYLVMQCYTFANSNIVHLTANLLYHTRYFMSQGKRSRAHGRQARTVVRVGVANTGGFHLYQYITSTYFGNRNFLHLQRLLHINKKNCFHETTF